MGPNTEINREPSLQEMLDDQVMQTILTHDHVTRTDLEKLIRTTGKKLARHRQRNRNLCRSPAAIIGSGRF